MCMFANAPIEGSNQITETSRGTLWVAKDPSVRQAENYDSDTQTYFNLRCTAHANLYIMLGTIILHILGLIICSNDYDFFSSCLDEYLIVCMKFSHTRKMCGN